MADQTVNLEEQIKLKYRTITQHSTTDDSGNIKDGKNYDNSIDRV